MQLPDPVRSALGRLWARIRTLLDMLFLIRFSVLLGVLGVVLFLWVPQGREILRHLSHHARPLHGIWFLLATLLCAGSTWYCARLLFDWSGSQRFRQTHPRLTDWLPRLLAASIPLAFATQLAGLPWLRVVLVIAAVAFLILVWRRRRLASLGPRNVWDRYADLSIGAKRYLWISLAVSVACLVLFSLTWGQQVVAPWLGAGAVVLVGLGLLIPLGAILVYAGQVTGFPYLGALLVWGILISPLSDNHDVRLEADQPGIAAPDGVAGYYRAWRAALPTNNRGDGPVILVCAEGGGIRAAYWTDLVLSKLQDASGGKFARHVFAISGVSGGSVGAGAFAGQVASPVAGDHVARARRMFERDALSPTLSAFAFPDLFQRIVPFLHFRDRAWTLETAWENAWRVAGNEDDRFAQPFESLWAGQPIEVPLLFLNSTVVESGDRIIAQPLALTPEAFAKTFRQAENARTVTGQAFRLSTAAHMSARFTYVSPAGSIDRQDEPGRSIRVVDGGYFENSGAITAEEILGSILDAEGDLEDPHTRLVLIHITNDPRPLDGETAIEKRQTKRVFLGEVLSPLRALLNTRSARGFQAREHLWQEVERLSGDVFHFDLFQDQVELPLGWLLSDETFAEMDEQLERGDNGSSLAALLAMLPSP